MGDIKKFGAYIEIPFTDDKTIMAPDWQRFFIDFIGSTISIPGNGIIVASGSTVVARSVVAGSSKVLVTNGNGTAGNISIDIDDTSIDHNTLVNYVANEHVDHSTVSVNAGAGLSGGGTIDATVNLAVDLNELTTELSIASGDFIVMVDITDSASGKITFSNFESTLAHDNLSGVSANEHIDWTSATDNLSTTGTLTADSLSLTASTNHILFDSDGANVGTLRTNTLSANREWKLPNASGTLPTTSSTSTFTNKSIDATTNTLSNIAVSNLANGTDGELITWSAAGAPTTVATGTSGHVLTSNGAGAAPTFQASGANGILLQHVYSSSSTEVSTTTTIPSDDTIPQNTEGTEILTVSITPNNTNNILVIEVFVGMTSKNGAGTNSLAIFQDSTANALASTGTLVSTANARIPMICRHIMVAGTTSSTTFKVRFGPDSGTGYVSRFATGHHLTADSYTINVMEIEV